MYFDEDLVLDLRFNILKDHVDQFVVAEATKDHGGKDKKLNFDINNFPKFKDKITYIVVDDMPMNLKYYKKDWPVNHLRDQHQRNALTKGYKNCSEEDWKHTGPCDRIFPCVSHNINVAGAHVHCERQEWQLGTAGPEHTRSV